MSPGGAGGRGARGAGGASRARGVTQGPEGRGPDACRLHTTRLCGRDRGPGSAQIRLVFLRCAGAAGEGARSMSPPLPAPARAPRRPGPVPRKVQRPQHPYIPTTCQTHVYQPAADAFEMTKQVRRQTQQLSICNHNVNVAMIDSSISCWNINNLNLHSK